MVGSLFAGLSAPGACAAELKFPTAAFHCTIIGESLRVALQQFGDEEHLRIDVSEAVKGRLDGPFSASTPRGFLEALTTSYGLQWYFDGSVVYVTQIGESESKLVAVPRDGLARLRSALDAAEVSDRRFYLRPVPQAGEVLVSGPPKYVALVEEIAEAQRAPAAVASESASATVYRGAVAERVEFPSR